MNPFDLQSQLKPFRFFGPGVINFSGGRTSGLMLRRVLDAYGGQLPDEVFVLFENTGKEREETLVFVNECSIRYGVPIIWLEYDGKVLPEPEAREGRERLFKIVTFETASRNGEPFDRLIEDTGYLPNPAARFCSSQLKARTAERFMRSLGIEEYTTFVGLRYDEMDRVVKLNDPKRSKLRPLEAPLASPAVRVTKKHVSAHWKEQPFDLELPDIDGVTPDGNCDLCMLKHGEKIMSTIRREPERAAWWIKKEEYARIRSEKASGALWRLDRPTYAQMLKHVERQGDMLGFENESLTDCHCTN